MGAGQQYLDNGLAARIAFAKPPRSPKRWSDEELDPDLESDVGRVFDSLYDLEQSLAADGSHKAQIVRLSPEAKAVWRQFVDDHGAAQAELTGPLAAAWAKLEAMAARIALVLHCAREAAQVAPRTGTLSRLDEQSIRDGIELMRWFSRETKRTYDLIQRGPVDPTDAKLYEWLRDQSGPVSVRDVQRGLPRDFRTAADATRSLEQLTRQGLLDHTIRARGTPLFSVRRQEAQRP